MAFVMSEELSYWSNLDETLIGMVFRDTTDDDFGWVMMARDRAGRFRCVDVEASISSERRATASLRIKIAEVSASEIGSIGDQADEPNAPVDLLAVVNGIPSEALHPYFRLLLENPGKEPARAVIRELGPWLAPADPHFISEFQQHQFDQRLWEMLLWAAFRDMGWDVQQLEAPDFQLSAPGAVFCVEATTIAPSTMGPLAAHPDPKTHEEMVEFLSGYMPMKFGSSLMSKLKKVDKGGRHYWEKEEAKGLPFILAVADFHKPAKMAEAGSMVYTQSALWTYLYGRRVDWKKMSDGTLVTNAVVIDEHSYQDKKVESGFFDAPDAENISAVLFSNAGTIAKFDRMGVTAGFIPAKHKYFRVGLKYDPDPNAVVGLPFSVDVSDSSYKENWFDELQIFHNPRAKFPIPTEWFPGVTHWFFDGENVRTFAPDDRILSSYTMIFQSKE